MNGEGQQARDSMDKLRANIAALKRPARVLVIEDEDADYWLLCDAILKHSPSTELRQARDYDEAVKSVEINKWDLIFLDLILPRGRSGIDVLRYAKSFNYPAPFVVITGYDDRSDLLNEALREGATAVCSKQKEGLSGTVKLLFEQLK
jgi:CheY-like chemotaxis protein